jgi:siroheme synthase-like protein
MQKADSVFAFGFLILRSGSRVSLISVFLKLTGRPCLVVGAGRVGEPKIKGLVAAGATVKVVAPEVKDEVAKWARVGKIFWQARRFEPSDLYGVFLVVVATSSRELNDESTSASHASVARAVSLGFAAGRET